MPCNFQGCTDPDCKFADYNPVTQEKEPMNVRQFTVAVKSSINKWYDDLSNQNDFMKGEHTFDEWMAAFGRYMSW